MEFLQKLFKRQSNTSESHTNTTSKHYRSTDYNYQCSDCGTDNVKVKLLRLTEAFYGPYQDASGNTHTHDYNRGMVELNCINNHCTQTKYIAACECGWHS